MRSLFIYGCYPELALIGPNVGIYTAMHPIDWCECASGIEYGEPVTIGDYCWVFGVFAPRRVT